MHVTVRARLGACIAAIGLTLTGCGDSGTDTSTTEFNVGLHEARHPSAQQGETLHLVAGELDSFDPARSYQPAMWNVMRLYTRQLVTYAAAPGDAGTALVPDLAESLGQPSEGGQVWTYTLKPGLMFEDGTAITSQDLKYGIERLFASDVIKGGPTWAVQLLDDQDSSYRGVYADDTPDKLGLASIETPDDLTIVFRLNRPFSDWDYVMALPASSPVPRQKDTGADYEKAPISCGPYRLASIADGQITFERNTQWSRTTDPVRMALPDRIELVSGLEPQERDRRLLAQEADADISSMGMSADSVRAVLNDSAAKERADYTTNGLMQFIAIATSVPPFDNEHCRRAVHYAVNRAAIKDTLGGSSTASLATTLWPRELPGYPATARYLGGEGNQGDLVSARSELSRCNNPKGFTTKLATIDGGRDLKIAEEVRIALERVGINVELTKFPADQFYLDGIGNPQKVHDSRIGLIVSSVTADFPTPSAFYVPMTDTRSIRSPANTNLAVLSHPELQQQLEEALATTDRSALVPLWQAYDNALMETATYVPIVEYRALIMGSDRLTNAYVHLAYHGYDLAAIGVA